MESENNCYGKALFSYQGIDHEELSFEVKDIIKILERDSNGWWKGKLYDKIGVFPFNYVQVLTDDEAKEILEPTEDKIQTQQVQEQAPDPQPSESSVVTVPQTQPKWLEETRKAPSLGEISRSGSIGGLPLGSPKKSPVLKEGWLNKKGHVRRNWKARYFLLKSGVLEYYKTKPIDLKLQGYFLLPLDVLVEKETSNKERKAGERKNCFNVISLKKNEVLTLDANGHQEMEEWMDAIKNARG